jgi:hypothetical protein
MSTDHDLDTKYADLDAKYLFYVTIGNQPEKRVTAREFRSHEAGAGFHPKPGLGPLATGGFSTSANGGTKGRMVERRSAGPSQ